MNPHCTILVSSLENLSIKAPLKIDRKSVTVYVFRKFISGNPNHVNIQ